MKKAALLCSILFFIIGSVQIYRWSEGIDGFRLNYLINYLPFLVLLIWYLVQVNFSSRDWVHFIAIPIFFCATGYCIFLGIGLEFFISVLGKIEDVDRYEEIIGEFKETSSLADHFPLTIPEDAEKVRFSYFPGFLQGGGHLQLRYASTPENIEKLYEKFVEVRTISYLGGGFFTHVNEENGVPTASFHTDSGSIDFPDDFEIMVFDKLVDSDCNWNHGQSHGVVISKQRSEIVFYAEFW